MIRGELADRAERLLADRAPFAIATVVRARHPTSVRAGDSALVLADGTIEGFVGGGCAQSSVRLHALRSMETGEPVLLRIVPDEADQIGSADGAVVEHNPCLSGGALEIFLEPQLPAARLVVIGHSPIAQALDALASASGYEVARGVDSVRDGAAAVVVASQGADEEGALAAALHAGVPYVALVASRVRGEAVRAALDVPDELRVMLRTPAGLDIGARVPSEIAVSILAELIAEQRAHPAEQSAASSRATAIDPICGMEVEVSDATPHLDTPQGRVYFCSEGCRNAYAGRNVVST
jgi:xanthine dehydrogenase accessory factor